MRYERRVGAGGGRAAADVNIVGIEMIVVAAMDAVGISESGAGRRHRQGTLARLGVFARLVRGLRSPITCGHALTEPAAG
jgi:hypothetical protein